MTNTALAGALCAIAFAGTAAAQTQTVSFDIPAEPLGASLRDFARESGQQIIFTDDLVAGKSAPALHGSYSPEEGLSRLLANSNLMMERSPSGSIMVRSKNAEAASNDGAATRVETIVVTGTLIPGAIPASPVTTVTQKDIAASGYATVGAVLKAMPVFFAGGQNVDSGTSLVNNAGDNFGYQTTANLRGLGSDATLTLVDGHRMSYGGINNGVDLGLIPTAAIDRVEILTDGASALYGSDAVAGVVNIKLRDDFEGVKTSVRLGTTSDGGGDQTQVNQLTGFNWGSGNVVAGYENITQGAIRSDQRSYSLEAGRPTDLIPDQSRNQYFLSASQDLTSSIRLFAQGLYSAQGTDDVRSLAFPPFTAGATFFNLYTASHVSEYSTTAGIDVDLPADWTSELSLGISGNQTRSFQSENVNGVPRPAQDELLSFSNTVYDVSATATGSVFSLPGGDVKLAVGADYRHERISTIFLNSYAHGRDVADVYGELQVPIVSPDASRIGLERLDLSASARFEHYSDFGNATTPKIGIVYEPVADLRLRATWGRSFRAPTLDQVYGLRDGYQYFSSDIAPVIPPGLVIIINGSNPLLKPETSNNWTTGFDYTPSTIPGLTINFTAYGIEYKDRINIAFNNYTSAYTNPAYAPYVIKNPTAGQIQAATAGLFSFTDTTGGSNEPVVALFDSNYQNAQGQSVDGFDLGARYHLDSTVGAFDFSGSASWLRLTQKNTALTPSQVLTGSIYYPAVFRSRDGINWTNNAGLSASAFLNFTAPETDNFSSAFGVFASPTVHLSAWTTIDAQLAYAFSEPGVLNGFKVALAATNLLDEAPPTLAPDSTYPPGIGYDATNANPYGRLISVTLTKDW